MSALKQVLDQFFAHPQKRVLALKGKWGVGKTYAWNRYAEHLKTTDATAMSYVSLFGATSISDIKRLILEKAVLLKAARFNKTLGKLKSTWALAKFVPKLADFANVAQHAAELLLKNFIVCLDDVERRARGLRLATVLGFVALLKERNGCRVLLIFNEDELSDADLKDLDRYREKIIDLEYTYAPTTEENAALIFKDGSYPFALEVFKSMEVCNIRVMQQTAWNLSYFAPFTEDLLPSSRVKFLRNVALLTCLFHMHGREVDFEHLDRISLGSFILAKGQDDDTVAPQERLLHRLGYAFTEPDAFIATYLKHGSMDSTELRSALKSMDDDERKGQIREQLVNVWNSFTGNFQTTEATFIAQATEFLDKHAADIAWGELQELCALLHQFQSSLDTERWTTAFLHPRIRQLQMGDLETYRGIVKNPALLAELEARRKQLLKSVSVKDVIYRIAQEQSWSPEDMAVLNAFSEADYLSWIEKETDPMLMAVLERLLTLCHPRSPDDPERAVGAKLFNVLKRMAETDSINKLRVERVLRIDLLKA